MSINRVDDKLGYRVKASKYHDGLRDEYRMSGIRINWRLNSRESMFSITKLFKSLIIAFGMYNLLIWQIEFVMLNCFSEKKHYAETKFN